MVFIVKLPARGASQRAGEPAPAVDAHQDGVSETEGGVMRAAPPVTTAPWMPAGDAPLVSPGASAAAPEVPAAGRAGGAPDTSGEHKVPVAPEIPATPVAAEPVTPARATAPVEPAGPPEQRTLDILLAPSVLRHRYVRGVDKSNIVERPERIRAVLLGIAAVYGLWDGAVAHTKAETPDDLAAMLSGIDMNRERPAPAPAMRVLVSERALALDAAESALAFVHAHEPAAYETATAYFGASEPCGATHLARLVQLGAQAPSAAPDRVQHRPATGSDDTSSDGEGDARMHPSEIPEHLPQGDLYLCGPHAAGARDTQDGGSREAISHALGAAVDAVDRVVAGAQAAPPTLVGAELVPGEAVPGAAHAARATPHRPARRAFVLTRPPGHHCSGAEPQGFCWVNNAVVAAAHAHAAHGIDRVIVLDIDLHHGNGTQALAWRINADAAKANEARAARLAAQRRTTRGRRAERRETYEQLLEDEALAGPRALQLCYASLHDIDSFPCEDGDAELVRNASVCLGGAHGQWIWNGTWRPRMRT